MPEQTQYYFYAQQPARSSISPQKTVSSSRQDGKKKHVEDVGMDISQCRNFVPYLN